MSSSILSRGSSFSVAIILLCSCGGGDDASTPADSGSPADSTALDTSDGATDGDADAAPVVCADPTSGPVARFTLPATGKPAVLDVPWPSDVYRDDSGKLPDAFPGLERIIPQATSTIAPQFAIAGAFGLTGGTVFAVEGDAAIDPKSLPDEKSCGKPGSGAFIVDLDAKDAASALLPCTASYYDERARKVPTTPGVVLRPAIGVALPSNHHVAFILTNAVKGVDGKPLQPSANLAAIRQPPAGGGALTKDAQLYKDAIDKAAMSPSASNVR
jgi:hypothetical protein